MLPERVRELLTAYVDGVLRRRQRRAVERLRQSNAEARAFLQHLESDSALLRALPQRQPTADLAAKTLQTIHARGLLPQPSTTRRVRLVWSGWAVAASVLLAIGAGSYLFFALALGGTKDSRTAGNKSGKAAVPAVVEVRPRLPVAPDRVLRPVQPDAPGGDLADNSGSRPADDKPVTVVGAELDPAKTEVLPLAPTAALELFQDLPDPRLALVFKLRELEPEKIRKLLRDDRRHDNAYRIELDCRASGKALERLQAAFRAYAVRLIVDHDAADRLKRGLRTNFILYAENLMPDELEKFLQRLGQDDRQAEAKKRGDGQFERVVVNPMQPADHKQLAKLLGVDPTRWHAERPKSPLGVDVRKPLADQTADQVVQSLKGQGAPGDRPALVLAYNPVRPRPSSKEVKLFLDERKEPRSGSVQVLFVLRGRDG